MNRGKQIFYDGIEEIKIGPETGRQSQDLKAFLVGSLRLDNQQVANSIEERKMKYIMFKEEIEKFP